MPKILAFILILGFISFPILIWSQANHEIGVRVKSRLALCQDGADNDGDFLIDFSTDPQCDSSTDDDENVTGAEVHATQDFTVSGGSFSFNNADGLAVGFSFPSDFHSTSTRLFANSYANDFFSSTKPAAGDKEFVGKTYDILLYDISTEAELTSVSKAITITLRYQDSDVPASTSESTIAPYSWGDADSSWQLISGASLNTTNNSVEFSTSSFGGTSFALFAEPAAAEEEAPAAPYPGGFVSGYIPPIVPEAPPEIPEVLPPVCPRADFNCDNRVDIRDLSILLYFWGKPMEIAADYDLNDDGKIDIRDVSILLYYWTG